MDFEAEFKVWQGQWKVDTGEDNPGTPSYKARLVRKARRPVVKLFLIFISTIAVLLLIVAHRQERLNETLMLLNLAIGFLLAALWFGGSGSGSDPVLERPDEYINSNMRIKSKEIERLSVARVASASGLLISFLAALFETKKSPSWYETVAVLFATTITTGILSVIRAKKCREWVALSKLEFQLDNAKPYLDVGDRTKERTDTVQSASSKSVWLFGEFRQWFPSKQLIKKKKYRRI